jgi:hypothetical protein
MRLLLRLVAIVVALVVVFAATIFGASEFGGEVVNLRTDEGGKERGTHLWVVDEGGYAWLRAGVSTSGWLKRIEASPDVVVERASEAHHMRAVPVHEPAVRDRIHALMREKYQVADRIVSLLRDPAGSVPVRLERRG